MNRLHFIGRVLLLAVILSGSQARAEADGAAASASRLADRLDVISLASGYAWGVDTLDREMLAGVFAADAVADYVAVGPNPMNLDEHLEGFPAIFDWLHANLAHRKGTAGLPMHFVSNELAHVDGDAALLRYYMHNRASSVGGVYYVKAVRTPEGWRIRHLRLEEQTWDPGAYADDPHAQKYLKGPAAD